MKRAILQIVVLAVVAVCSTLIWYTSRKKFDREEFERVVAEQKFWSTKILPQADKDFVILGDSRAYRGLSPAHISSELGGLRGYNLGFSSGGYSDPVFDLALRHLDPQGAKILILALAPQTLTPWAAKNYHLNTLNGQSYLDHLAVVKWGDEISYLSPVLRKAVKRRSQPEVGVVFNDDGFASAVRAPLRPTDSVPVYIYRYKRRAQVSKRIFAQFLATVRELRQKNFMVYVYVPPVSPELEEVERTLSGFYEMSALERLTEVGAKIIPLDSREFVSYDGSHLLGESGELLGKKIGQFIRENPR